MRNVNDNPNIGKVIPLRKSPLTSTESPLLKRADEFLKQLDDLQQISKSVYVRHLRPFLIFISDNKLEDIIRKDVLTYKKHLREIKKLSPYTQSHYLGMARRFLEYLHPEMPNKIRGIKIKKGSHRRDPLTAEQANQLLGSIPKEGLQNLRDYAILTPMLHTAVRTIEVVRALVNNISLTTSDSNGVAQHILWVWGKAHESPDEFVVLAKQPYEAIMTYLNARGPISGEQPLFASCSSSDDGKPPRKISTRSIRRMFCRRMNAAKIFNPKCTAHSTRSSALICAILANVDLRRVSKFARHSSLEVTDRYLAAVDRTKNPVEQKIRLGRELNDSERLRQIESHLSSIERARR